mgnify:CR=1 FL=1|jgi:hypothetical protein
MTVKPDDKEKVNGKRTEAPAPAQSLLNEGIGSPMKESGVIPKTGNSKKLDKK